MPTLMNLALDLHTTVPGQNTKHNRLLPNDLVLVSQRIFAQNLSYENEFDLHEY